MTVSWTQLTIREAGGQPELGIAYLQSRVQGYGFPVIVLSPVLYWMCSLPSVMKVVVLWDRVDNNNVCWASFLTLMTRNPVCALFGQLLAALSYRNTCHSGQTTTMSLARSCRPTLSHIFHSRAIHCSAARSMARMNKAATVQGDELADAILDLKAQQIGDDTSAAGHMVLQQQRKLLYYLRLIEHEMPKLVGEYVP